MRVQVRVGDEKFQPVDDATVAWAKQANAKAVARWSMLQVFETTDNWTMHDIAKQLGLGPDNTQIGRAHV